MEALRKEEIGSVKCSFCGRGKETREAIVAGPGVYICSPCVKDAEGVLARLPPDH